MWRFLFVIFFLFSLTAMADTANDHGPAVGTPIPHTLAAKDQKDTAQSFTSLTGSKGAVLVFYRSADWCPFCQMQLIDLNLHAREKAAALGYNLIGISYDPVATLEKFSNKWSVAFPLLSDDGSQIIDAFGLRNDSRYKPGDMAWGVPYPMLVVTDNEGTVLAKLSKEGYRDRPEPTVLIETLEGLAGH